MTDARTLNEDRAAAPTIMAVSAEAIIPEGAERTEENRHFFSGYGNHFIETMRKRWIQELKDGKKSAVK